MCILQNIKHESSHGFDHAFVGYRRIKPTDGNPSYSILDREGIIELVQYHGTDTLESDKSIYHNGNDQPQGFGHLCLSVDDLDAACARFEDLKDVIRWKKRLTDGRMKNVAFLLDPDGYWIE